MPSHRSLWAIYTIFSSPIWQPAMAAPAMTPFTTHVSTFRPYVDPSGYVLQIGRGGYERYSHDHLHGASIKGLTFVRRPDLSPQEKALAALVHHWHYQTNHAPTPLGIGNEKYWAELSNNHKEVLNGRPLEKWFEDKKIPKPSHFEKSAPDFEYMLKRAESGKAVWWRSEQLVHWQKNGYDWISMTKMGDVLEFDKPGLQSMADATLAQKGLQLKKLIGKGKWHTSIGYNKKDPNGCLEFLTLHTFKDDAQQPMIHRLKTLFSEDVRRQLHDVYVKGSELNSQQGLGPGRFVSPDAPAPGPEPGASDHPHDVSVAGSPLDNQPGLGPGKLVSPDAPAPGPEPGASDHPHDVSVAGSTLDNQPGLGPGKLVSPDAPAPTPETGASDVVHHFVAEYPSTSADSPQHKKWLDKWLSFFGNHP